MNPSASNPPLRLYSDLADWYPLLTPVGDYAEEAAFYLRLFKTHCKQPPGTLLDLAEAAATTRPISSQRSPALHEITGKRRDRVYAYQAYLQVLAHDTD